MESGPVMLRCSIKIQEQPKRNSLLGVLNQRVGCMLSTAGIVYALLSFAVGAGTEREVEE